MTFTPMLLLSLVSVLPVVLGQSCMWKNGQEATDYYSCNPTAPQSQCCLQGEACVGNGLCYGALGAIYRGACAGGWGNDTACPQACNDQGQDGSWANLFLCPSIAAPSGASSWWCGDTGTVAICDQDGTNSHPTKAEIFSLPWNGMNPLAIMPLSSADFTGCAVNQDNSYSVEKQIANATKSSSGSSSSSSSSSSTSGSGSGSASVPATVSATCPNGAQIGEGVAIGVVSLVAILMAIWAFHERRQKNKLLAGGVSQKQQEVGQYHQPPQAQQAHQPPELQHQQYYEPSKQYTTPVPAYQSPQRPVVSEMSSFGNEGRPHAHEMQS